MTKQGDVKPIATQQRIPMGGYVLFAILQSSYFTIQFANSQARQLTNLKYHELNNSLMFPTL